MAFDCTISHKVDHNSGLIGPTSSVEQSCLIAANVHVN